MHVGGHHAGRRVEGVVGGHAPGLRAAGEMDAVDRMEGVREISQSRQRLLERLHGRAGDLQHESPGFAEGSLPRGLNRGRDREVVGDARLERRGGREVLRVAVGAPGAGHVGADRRVRRSGGRCARQPDPQRGGAIDACAVWQCRQGRMRLRRDRGCGGHRGAGLVGAPEQAADSVVQAGHRDDRHDGDHRRGQQQAGRRGTSSVGPCRGVSVWSAKATEKPGGTIPFEHGPFSTVAHLPQGNALQAAISDLFARLMDKLRKGAATPTPAPTTSALITPTMTTTTTTTTTPPSEKYDY